MADRGKMVVNDVGGIKEWSITALSTVIKICNIIGFLPVDLKKTLRVVVDETYALFSPALSVIYLADGEGRFEPVVFKAAAGMPADLHTTPSIDECTVLRDNLPYIACGENICPNRDTLSNDYRSHVCIPMMTGNDIHGVLSLTFKHERSLDRDELNVLLSVAGQASAAIQRFRLFERLRNEKAEIERAYSEISKLNEILKDKIEELNDTRDRLIQSEKLAATGELSAGLCHEINNPINIILNRIECLKMEAVETSLPDGVLKDLDVIYSYAAKVSSIVQDLLIFSRHHSVECEDLDTGLLLRRVEGVLLDEIKRRNCSLHVDIHPSGRVVCGDAERLEQVFMNLISNAVDAMPDGGNISIEAEGSRERPEFVEITIADEGMGIKEEDLNRIFDPFFTTKRLGKGSGLGLSICYGIVKNHGGDITVRSRQDEGTVFTLYLPGGRRPDRTAPPEGEGI